MLLRNNPSRYDGFYVGFDRNFTISDFEKKTYNCTVKLVRVFTPAGIILYPLLITLGNKSLRPLTIDGLHFIEEKGILVQVIMGMVTPLADFTIIIVLDRNEPIVGLNTFKCEMITRGNPFESVFAIETKKNHIALYHHTNKEAKRAILASKKINASNWNFQGTKTLSHINYIYLTDIKKIERTFELFEIGMAAAI